MFRWKLMLQKRFGVTGQQTETRLTKRTVKPQLEELRERILPSASSLPVVSVASPPPMPSIAAITSYVTSMMEQRVQLITAIEQDLSNALNALGQKVSFAVLQWDPILGINPTPAPNNTVLPPSSSNGMSQGHASGSGSGATPDQPIPSGQGSTKGQPVTSGSGRGIATPESSANATVTGQVWLDNNGDSSLDDNEMGYTGARVNLFYQVSGGNTWYTYGSAITSSNKQGYNYSFGVSLTDLQDDKFQIQVVLSQYFTPTLSNPNSVIDAQGWSPVFSLSPGGVAVKPAGLRSMNVNTITDDPDGPAQQNTVTLRDAIETGNDGPPFPAVTFSGAPAGTITLQKALDPIKTSYDIYGPGAANIAVNGNFNSSTIFTINAGVTSTISDLTIEGGSNVNGGGITNNGSLTLNGDTIYNNRANGGGGGGVLNTGAGATLDLQGVTIYNNDANTGGGLANVGGLVTITGSSVIRNNESGASGGGVSNVGGYIKASDNTQIYLNVDSGTLGGGVENKSGKFKMIGGSIYDNEEAGNGGGVGNSLGTITLTGVAIQGNAGGGRGAGGGIYVNGGKMALDDVSIDPDANGKKNIANIGGGAAIGDLGSLVS